MVNTIRKLFYNFKSLKYVIDIKQLKILYISLIQSLTYYWLPFWCGTYNDYLITLNTTISGLINIIISKLFLYPSNQLYIDFNISHLSVLYYKPLLLLVYKYKYCLNTVKNNYDTRNKLHSNLNNIKFYNTITSQESNL